MAIHDGSSAKFVIILEWNVRLACGLSAPVGDTDWGISLFSVWRFPTMMPWNAWTAQMHWTACATSKTWSFKGEIVIQSGPLPVVSRIIVHLWGLFFSQLPIYEAISRVPKTPFMGPTLYTSITSKLTVCLPHRHPTGHHFGHPFFFWKSPSNAVSSQTSTRLRDWGLWSSPFSARWTRSCTSTDSSRIFSMPSSNFRW